MNLRTTIEETIKEWNTFFPFDYVWRKKHNIPFGSKEHFSTSFFNMIVDIKEDSCLNKYIEQLKEKEGGVVIETFVGQDSQKKGILEMSEKQIQKEFDDLDFTKFNSE